MPDFEEALKVQGSNAKCDGCGGNLTFDPSTQSLKCPNCGNTYKFDRTKGQKKNEYAKRGDTQDNQHDSWAKESKIVKCQTCGAEIVLDGLSMTSCCPYCGSDYVAESDKLPGLKPDVVTPFAFDEDEAAERFAKGIRKKFFAPGAFKKKLPKSKIHGIYVPSFTFDCDTLSKYHGTLEEEIRHRDSKGNVRVEHRRFPISGTKEMEHRNYLIESSSKLQHKEMDAMLPYDLSESYLFTPDFIRGYAVEHYEDSVEQCYSDARKEIEEKIKDAILKKYNYDHVVSFGMDTHYSNELYSYRLLPVYCLEFTYKEKKYMTYMNGQTGKIGTGYPISKAKKLVVTGLIVLAILAVIGLIFYLAYLDSESGMVFLPFLNK